MKSFIKIFFIALIGVSISIISFWKGYSVYNERLDAEKLALEKNRQQSEAAMAAEQAKITPSTKMVYEYYYKKDGNKEVLEEVPPYFFIDKTRKQLENELKGWTVTAFDSSEVVLRKDIDSESYQHYVIGEYNGYVAVFYEKEVNGTSLKEVTDTPVESLPEEEQEKLKEGIKIDGDDNLMKILSDYGS